MKMDCIIVDDEPIAREVLTNYIKDIPYLNLVGSCRDAFEAMRVLKEKNIGLMILDIQMPRLSGFSMLRMLKPPPAVIITSAYAEYALEGYELAVTDYLLKPFSFERFVQATEKLMKTSLSEVSPQAKAAEQEQYLFVKSDRRYLKIPVSDIRFIEAARNYVNIYVSTGKIMTKQPLSGLEKQLPATEFTRIHKSYLVAWRYIKYVEGN